jgi:hypothetical protein
MLRGFGHLQDMDARGRPQAGMYAAADVHYLSTGGARAAAVLAADAAFAHVLAEHTTVLSWVPPYRPGQFYLREVPALRAVLNDLGSWACWWSMATPIWTPAADPAWARMRTPSSASRDRGGQVHVNGL